MLIGIIALIFLGPRRMPEIAKKIGKIMAEFRGTASEFKKTWQREVNLEEEAKALDINSLESEEPVVRNGSKDSIPNEDFLNAPEIKEVDPEKFEELKAKAAQMETSEKSEAEEITNDKQNWL